MFDFKEEYLIELFHEIRKLRDGIRSFGGAETLNEDRFKNLEFAHMIFKNVESMLFSELAKDSKRWTYYETQFNFLNNIED